MRLLTRIATALWFVDSCGVLVLLLRLGYLRFHRRYPALMLFLIVDLVGGVVGLRYGTGSLTYYWSYFLSNILAGAGLLIWMCREMFAELYCYHPGLPGLTQCTLKRSIFVGAVVTVGLAPVSIIHWGERDFQCWEFPFFEVHRCLTFGVVVFVVAMWRRLRLIPLNIPSNVKMYAFSTCSYLTLCGLSETAMLIQHTPFATLAWSVVLLASTLVFYGALAILAERPIEIRQPLPLPIDPEEFAWLYSISSLFARVDEAQFRGRTSVLRRLPFFRMIELTSQRVQSARPSWLLHTRFSPKGVRNGRARLRG